MKYILSFLFLVLLSITANAATITVDDSGGQNYSTIQSAIDAANTGDTILVYPGIYTENITISKQLNIYGQSENSEDVIVLPMGATNNIEITVPNVKLKYLSSNKNNITNGAGLKINASNDCTIENCAFKDNLYNGILNYNSHNTIIKKCYIRGTPGATNGVGLHINAPGYTRISYNVTVDNCTIWYAYNNINLDFANSNVIKESYIQNGVNFWGGSSNILYNNVFSIGAGDFHFEAASNNLIYNNVFLYNKTKVSYSGECTNDSFSLTSKTTGSGIAGGSQLGGNVWTNVIFNDTDLDGFSDTPYTVLTGINSTDNFAVVCNVSTAQNGSIPYPTWIGPFITKISWDVCTDSNFSKYILYRGFAATGKTNNKIYESYNNTVSAYTDSDPGLYPGRRNYYTLETLYTNGTSNFSSVECWSIHHTKKTVWFEGDSIATWPYGVSGEHGYVELLMTNYLTSLGWDFKDTAVSGKNVSESLNGYGIESNFYTKAQINDGELFINNIGINDMYRAPIQNVNDTYRGVYEELEYMTIRGSLVYYLLLMPVYENNNFQKTFNWMMIGNHPTNSTLINTFDTLDTLPENGDFDDYNSSREAQGSVHPNTLGSGYIADKIFLLLCVQGTIHNNTYHPLGPNTTKPNILGRFPQPHSIYYNGTSTQFNATLKYPADCAWYVNDVFLHLDFNTTTPGMPLKVRSRDFTVSMRAMNPENHSAYNEYYWKVTDKTSGYDAGNFFSTLFNYFYRLFFEE